MALLDLQAMDSPIVDMATGSDSSHTSCDASTLSVAVCEGHSNLSVAICFN